MLIRMKTVTIMKMLRDPPQSVRASSKGYFPKRCELLKRKPRICRIILMKALHQFLGFNIDQNDLVRIVEDRVRYPFPGRDSGN